MKPIRRIWFDELCLAIGRRAPPLQKLGHVNGTMAVFTQTVASTSRVLLWADAFLRGASQVVLTNNPISGALIIGGLFAADAFVASCGVVGLFGATATAVLLRLDLQATCSGLFGYNGLLVGLGLATFLVGEQWALLVLSLVLGALSTVLQQSLGNALVPTFKCPPFTLAFNVTLVLFVAASYKLGRFHPAPFLAPALGADAPLAQDSAPDGAAAIGWALHAALVSVGQIFLCNSAVTGALIVGGMAVASRVAAAVAYLGALGGVALAVGLGASHAEVAAGLWGYNASLGATAVFTFFYPNGLCCVFAAVAVALSVVLDGFFKASFAPLGVPTGTLPFCFAAIAVVLTHGQVPGLAPVAISDVASPEDHLYSARAARTDRPDDDDEPKTSTDPNKLEAITIEQPAHPAVSDALGGGAATPTAAAPAAALRESVVLTRPSSAAASRDASRHGASQHGSRHGGTVWRTLAPPPPSAAALDGALADEMWRRRDMALPVASPPQRVARSRSGDRGNVPVSPSALVARLNVLASPGSRRGHYRASPASSPASSTHGSRHGGTEAGGLEGSVHCGVTVGLKVDMGCCRSPTSMPSTELSPTSPMMSHGPMTPGRSLHGSLNDLPALAEAAEGGGSNAASAASSPEKMKKTVVAVKVDRA